MMDIDLLQQIPRPLVRWYRKSHRILPWRDTNNAYLIWVSEIMLQQTRVEAVKPYFERFVTCLPDVRALAQCQEEKLLKLWEGLGYYNRVRNMQRAARVVVEQYGGTLPRDVQKLLALPGIGRYTAGAIASIAYGIPVPAVDGNVLRVIARVTRDRRDILNQSVKKQVEEALLKVMPADCPGDFNQALMELGAVVCVPNGMVQCEVCPLTDFCLARASGCVGELPVRKGKKPRKIEKRTILVIHDADRVALRRRGEKGLLAGLYELPGAEGHLSEEEALALVADWDLDALRIKPLAPARHLFTHVEWQMIGYEICVAALDQVRYRDLIFVNREDTKEKYAVPSAFNPYMGEIKEDS